MLRSHTVGSNNAVRQCLIVLGFISKHVCYCNVLGLHPVLIYCNETGVYFRGNSARWWM